MRKPLRLPYLYFIGKLIKNQVETKKATLNDEAKGGLRRETTRRVREFVDPSSNELSYVILLVELDGVGEVGVVEETKTTGVIDINAEKMSESLRAGHVVLAKVTPPLVVVLNN